MNLRRLGTPGDSVWRAKAAARGLLRTALTPKGVAVVRRLRASGLSGVLRSKEDRRLFEIARKCLAEADRFSWYDSKFLRQFEAARKFIGRVRPDRLDDFVSAFGVLRTDPTFQTKLLDPVFEADTFEAVVETIHALPKVSLQYHEGDSFGRSLIRRHPFFTRLQSSLTERVSELVGEPVVAAYNFLSLYGGKGRCDPHLDQPLSKWTLDICVEQSVEWPIHFSQVVDWPSESGQYQTTIEELRANPSLRFDSVVLKPNGGAIFSGSSQWHFRDPLDARDTDYCTLLFLHYLPKGAEPLADPHQWAGHFGIPELRILASADNG